VLLQLLVLLLTEETVEHQEDKLLHLEQLEQLERPAEQLEEHPQVDRLALSLTRLLQHLAEQLTQWYQL